MDRPDCGFLKAYRYCYMPTRKHRKTCGPKLNLFCSTYSYRWFLIIKITVWSCIAWHAQRRAQIFSLGLGTGSLQFSWNCFFSTRWPLILNTYHFQKDSADYLKNNASRRISSWFIHVARFSLWAIVLPDTCLVFPITSDPLPRFQDSPFVISVPLDEQR